MQIDVSVGGGDEKAGPKMVFLAPELGSGTSREYVGGSKSVPF